MGSTKKHKEKDKEKDKDRDKKSHKEKKKKHKSRSRSPIEDLPQDVKSKDKSHKKKHKDMKRKHDESDDSDIPTAKSSRYDDNDNNGNNSPELQRGSGDSLSIDETNKLRIKLGLKPLQVGSGPPQQQQQSRSSKQAELEDVESGEEFDEETLRRIREEREKEGETFWKEKQDFVHAPAENLTSKREADKFRERLEAQREKRRLEDKLLKGKGLADSDDEEITDASKWVSRQKKLLDEKALADKREKALQELDNEFGVGELVESQFQKQRNKAYGVKDLKGLKVLHGHERFLAEDTPVVLTLQDKGVLDEEDDTLVNVNMIDDEKYEKNVVTRRLRPELQGYDPFEDSTVDQYGIIQEKSVLGKYDEEIGGEKKKSFVIGQDMSEEAKRARMQAQMQRADKILESIDAPSLRLASDFYSPDEMVSFKKTKKKVRKVRKVLKADDLLKMNAGTAQADHGSRRGGTRSSSTVTSNSKSDAVDMEIDFEMDDMLPVPEIDISDVRLEDEGDLDFQLALSKSRKVKQKENLNKKPTDEALAELISAERATSLNATWAPSITTNPNMILHATQEFCRTLGDIPTVEGVDIYGDEKMDFEREDDDRETEFEEKGTWNEVSIDETPVDITRPPDTDEQPILEQEPAVGTGLAGALLLATKKGYLDIEKQKRVGAPKMRHLEAKSYTIEDKNYEEERVSSRREMYAGPVIDFREKDTYKPEFKLEYTDEDGKPISSKEAFRLLSHKFHGKGSGKNKIDKKRRKHEQEKLMQHMNSTDTPLGTLELLQQRQKESHSAYVVLSGKASQSASLTKSKH